MLKKLQEKFGNAQGAFQKQMLTGLLESGGPMFVEMIKGLEEKLEPDEKTVALIVMRNGDQLMATFNPIHISESGDVIARKPIKSITGSDIEKELKDE